MLLFLPRESSASGLCFDVQLQRFTVLWENEFNYSSSLIAKFFLVVFAPIFFSASCGIHSYIYTIWVYYSRSIYYNRQGIFGHFNASRVWRRRRQMDLNVAGDFLLHSIIYSGGLKLEVARGDLRYRFFCGNEGYWSHSLWWRMSGGAGCVWSSHIAGSPFSSHTPYHYPSFRDVCCFYYISSYIDALRYWINKCCRKKVPKVSTHHMLTLARVCRFVFTVLVFFPPKIICSFPLCHPKFSCNPSPALTYKSFIFLPPDYFTRFFSG